MKNKILICLALAAVLLSGCRTRNTPVHRVVTGITVSSDESPEQVLRHYTSPDKMRKMLHYIRMLDPYNKADIDPMAVKGRGYRIRLSYSDGSETVYFQRANRFFKSENDVWREIDPEHAIRLELILAAIPGD